LKLKKDLWIRLKQYRFQNLVPVSLVDRVKGVFGDTDAFTRAFAAKVAKKHGWTEEFAFLAVREYKKFVYLGVISHYEVTPPVVIDKVWHEHGLFMKGYREFCRDVLRQNFDHAPELIPFDDQIEVYNAQYAKTVAFYEHEFGTAPPTEIWGTPKFDPKKVKGTIQKPERKKESNEPTSGDSENPLYTMFNSGSDTRYAPIPVHFTGLGGTTGGGGASGGWHDSGRADTTPDSGSHSTSSCSSSSSSGGSSCGGGGGD